MWAFDSQLVQLQFKFKKPKIKNYFSTPQKINCRNFNTVAKSDLNDLNQTCSKQTTYNCCWKNGTLEMILINFNRFHCANMISIFMSMFIFIFPSHIHFHQLVGVWFENCNFCNGNIYIYETDIHMATTTIRMNRLQNNASNEYIALLRIKTQIIQ